MPDQEEHALPARTRRRPLQFTLRGLLVLTALAAVGAFAWRVGQTSEEQLAQDLRRRGAEVTLRSVPRLGGFVSVPKIVAVSWRRDDLTDRDLERLGRCSELKNLVLVGNLTDRGVAALAQCRHLKTLEIAASNLADKGMAPIAALPRLEELTLVPNGVESSRNERSPSPGTERLTPLRQGKSLRRITLHGVDYSDEAVPALLAIKSLREVTLRDARLSERAVDELRKHGIDVVGEGYDTPPFVEPPWKTSDSSRNAPP
jgi:hypothetical protein